MPTILLILAFLVIIAFVIGVAMLWQGYTSLPAPGQTAPASDLEKVLLELKAANLETEAMRTQANTLAVQLDEMKGKFTWAEGQVKSLEETLRKSSQAYKRVEQLEKDLEFLSQKADSQARESIEVINRLAAQAETLNSAPNKDTSAVELDKIKDENQKLQIQVDGYARKVKDLESAVEASKDAVTKQAELTKNNAKIVEENSTLKKNLADLEEKMKGSNPALLEEELKRVRSQSEEKILLANAALVKSNSDLETLNVQITEKNERIKQLMDELLSTREKLSIASRAVEQAKQAPLPAAIVVQDDTEKEILKSRLEELQTAHQRLLTKEKILIDKLTLSRAQASSLEQLCHDLKEQCERGVALK